MLTILNDQMATILQSVPKGQKVGIAFSGGLDTSAALHWMRSKGAITRSAYAANLGQPDKADYDDIPRKALAAARKGAARRLPSAARRGGTGGVAVRRLLHLDGRRSVPSTPRRTSAAPITGTMLVIAMKEDDVNVWGDGSTFKGNDIDGFIATVSWPTRA